MENDQKSSLPIKPNKFFEFIGLISVQFASIELECLFLLAKLINQKHKEIAYHFAEKENGVSRKLILIKKLIGKEPFKTILPNEVKQKMNLIFDDVIKLKKRRNELMHSILTINTNKDGTKSLQQLKFDSDNLVFTVNQEYNFTDMSNLFRDFLDVSIRLNKFNENITPFIRQAR